MPHLQMLEPKIRMGKRNSVSITLWKGTLLQHRVCKAFSMFGEKGKYIISGGNDKLVKVWDWSRYFDATQTSSNSDLLHLSINLSMKVKLALYHSSGLRQPYCLRHIKSGEGLYCCLDRCTAHRGPSGP
ncbi:hypothetical protein ACSBR2_028775 [Camellia fascicularis]